jgi:hypothetical protein
VRLEAEHILADPTKRRSNPINDRAERLAKQRIFRAFVQINRYQAVNEFIDQLFGGVVGSE